MRFTTLAIQGAYLIEIEPLMDARGFFARSFCEREFAANGIYPRFVQCSVSYNTQKGTLRGLHYAAAPYEEDKLVRCTRGAIYDVIVDVRRNSPTYRQWQSFELTAENHHLVFVPRGLAHGFKTLSDDCEVFYQMTEFYVPEAARGVRWDDPTLGIKWPAGATVISERDRSYPDLQP